MKPGAIDDLAGVAAGRNADFCNLAVAHANVARAFAIMIDHNAAA